MQDNGTTPENLLASTTRYVIELLVSLDGRRLALQSKNRGPAQLVGKVTYPGGHIEQTDPSPAHAASREAAEELGILVPPEGFDCLHVDINEGRELHVMFAAADLTQVRTMEDEVVFVSDIDTVAGNAHEARASHFAPDFVEQLDRAMPRILALRAAHDERHPPRSHFPVPSDRPNFEQCLNRERPCELTDLRPNGTLTELAPERRHHLVYRYLDTGETVIVPNAAYNVTKEMRAASIRCEAARREERAQRLLMSVPSGWTAAMAQNVAERLRANAERIREVAAKVERGELPWNAPWSLRSEQAPSHAWAREQEDRERARDAFEPEAEPSTKPAPRRPRG